MGDPAGVGPEVLLKALAVIASPPRFFGGRSNLTLIGDVGYLRSLSRRLRLTLPWEKFRLLDLANVPQGLKIGRMHPSSGRAAYQYLTEATRLLQQGDGEAFVTAPVSKEAVHRAGIDFKGHTEYLGLAFHCQVVMMLVTGRFRVSLVTTHLGLAEVSRRLKRADLVRVLKMTKEALVSDFGIPKPRIGLAALNPHAGEGGLFGKEEETILRPAVRSFKASAVRPELVEGPFPADSLIKDAAQGKYDSVVALYHDQALIPVKLIGWEQAVNVTLGLPFIRTSPVHGTAFDIAGKGRADPRSMETAIRLALQLARRRA